MPKYYCDYCDTHLTHDSPSVRKTHCSGRKHRDNVRNYYQKWMEEQAQHLIDVTTEVYKSKVNKIDVGMCSTLAAVPPPGYPFQIPQPNFSVPPPNMRAPPTMMMNTQTYMGGGTGAAVAAAVVVNMMAFNRGPSNATSSSVVTPQGVPPPNNTPPNFDVNYGLMLANYNAKI